LTKTTKINLKFGIFGQLQTGFYGYNQGELIKGDIKMKNADALLEELGK